MENKNCVNCHERNRCKDDYTSWIFFIVGLIATIAMRVVTVLMHMNPIYGKISWYIGVGGFFIFFVYKFKITQARSRLIEKQNILNKIDGEKLDSQDYKLIKEIICALSSNKEKINYFFIFILSALALIIAVYFDFFK